MDKNNSIKINLLNNYVITFLDECLHYYRYFITLIIVIYRNFMKIPMFAPKNTITKIFDFTYFNKHADVFYLKYPIEIHSLKNINIAKKLFKYHRSDPNSIFKGNNSMNRFLEIIQCMYPDVHITANDCILTCYEEYTKLYHTFLRKYLASSTVEERKQIIEDNIDKYFGNLDGQILDTSDLIDSYVCDNFTKMIFGKAYTDECVNFSEYCNKINEYIFTNRMRVLTPLIIFNCNDEKFKLILRKFRLINDRIVAENKDIFDEANFTPAQRLCMSAILLFAGQETTHVLINYTIFWLSKFKEYVNQLRLKKLSEDKIIDLIFNTCLAECTPAHGIARILKNDIEISADGYTKVYNKNSVLGPMISILATINKNDNINDYNNFVPFGIGKHRCPGEHLVLMETKLLIKYLLDNYDLTTNVKKLDFIQYMTQKITTKYVTKFTKINL